MKVFAGHEYYKTNNPKTIQLTPNLSKEDVTILLSRKGLILEKSETDDSTYGCWIVTSNQERYGSVFENFSEIINHYKLAYN